ncbi:glycosyltransferase [Halomonas sp. E19]|uniref:glycosyltransferase n=1 Tax=Halomonas sp. E19 TaxID=3397247 RepID=UPI004034B0D7
MQAVADVASQRPDLNFTYELIGDGPLWEQVAEQVRVLGMESRINLHGALPHDEVQRLLKDADIFLLPSVTASNGDQEGIPVALMEAMASGMPVLSTSHSGIPELVEEGVSGYLVPERDSQGLAAKLLDLLQHPKIRLAFGREGRKKSRTSSTSIS